MGTIKPEIAGKIAQLEEKFKRSGEDFSAYLDGLLYSEYLTYWDYISLDTLLSLQKTRTDFPDEQIFITYHQISELYFKLILHEQKQLVERENLTAEYFIERLNRISRYFGTLTDSFEVMVRGMERDQFLKFRMALLPASGFQSAQYRFIELYSTPLENLVHSDVRSQMGSGDSLEELYAHIYWKRGGTDLKSGEKTLTLRQFEEKYSHNFLKTANKLKNNTLYEKYLRLPAEERDNKLLIEALRNLDVSINVNWSLIHIGAAQRYLMQKKGAIPATGGTNWEEFLPPSFQKISFFPSLWEEEERKTWGKQWVDRILNHKT